ncbi:MAG TPA: hypothetical protein VK843_22960 [Planctomycetota bacterium]|nr:hypothetical protein [Planctomycetota bacterium]
MKIQRAALMFGLLALPLAFGQEPAKPDQTPPKPEEPEKERLHLPPMPGSQPDDGLKKELLELFAKVENRLRAIDTQMFEAAAGRVPVKPVVGSGIEELLKAGQQTKTPQNVGELLESAARDSQQAQTEIQRMLQIAQQLNKNSNQSGSPSDGPPKQGKGGSSPLDKQGKTPSGREATPKQPGSKPEKPDKPGDADVPKDSKQPDDPNRQDSNREGQKPPAAKTAPGSAANGADRWGDLPVRAREIFRVEGASDLPPQYRDWIDGYYRKLQSLERH